MIRYIISSVFLENKEFSTGTQRMAGLGEVLESNLRELHEHGARGRVQERGDPNATLTLGEEGEGVGGEVSGSEGEWEWVGVGGSEWE